MEKEKGKKDILKQSSYPSSWFQALTTLQPCWLLCGAIKQADKFHSPYMHLKLHWIKYCYNGIQNGKLSSQCNKQGSENLSGNQVRKNMDLF